MFQEELEANDVDFHCNFKTKFGSTARSFILITPDSERTMCTYLGEAANVTNEIDGTIIANSDILYIEGYLWDKDSTIKALKKAVLVAKENNTKVAFTLSDTFCVKRHKTEMLKLVSQTDILFANEEEINTLTSSEKLSTAKIKHLSVNNPNILIVITRSGKGAVIFEGETGKFLKVPAIETPNIVDATGAGDAFAAGFFYGLNKEYTLEDCAKIGHIFASNVIQKIGGRFEEEEISRITKLL
jgi:sugar/nucleoside kinase (ribokinase family)